MVSLTSDCFVTLLIVTVGKEFTSRHGKLYRRHTGGVSAAMLVLCKDEHNYPRVFTTGPQLHAARYHISHIHTFEDRENKQ